jgi:hypothetical protein
MYVNKIDISNTNISSHNKKRENLYSVIQKKNKYVDINDVKHMNNMSKHIKFRRKKVLNDLHKKRKVFLKL